MASRERRGGAGAEDGRTLWLTAIASSVSCICCIANAVKVGVAAAYRFGHHF
jgi:hypothetical protein